MGNQITSMMFMMHTEQEEMPLLIRTVLLRCELCATGVLPETCSEL